MHFFLCIGILGPSIENIVLALCIGRWAEYANFLQTAPWLLVYPGLAIFITVVLLNYISDALQDTGRV